VPAEADETDIPGQCPANVPIPVPVEPSPILKADPNRTVTFAAQQDGPLRVTCSSWPNAVAIWSEAAFRRWDRVTRNGDRYAAFTCR
jgi:hypothetical protein